jgi:hypothetical protein
MLISHSEETHGSIRVVENRYTFITEIAAYRPEVIPGAGEISCAVASRLHNEKDWLVQTNGPSRVATKRAAMARMLEYAEGQHKANGPKR